MLRSLCALTVALASCRIDAAALPQTTITAVERLVTAYRDAHRIPGMSIAVVADGKLAWSKAYGLADIENSVAARNATLYRSASIGKTMTATAAMRLVEAGALDLRADIRDYCPAFPAKAWRITPWNLLTHTSGIRHYGGPRDLEEQSSTEHYPSVVAALQPFKDDALQFEPGTKWQYSTYGFDVLGCVIEGAAHMPFLTYMTEQVWRPAGMLATRDDDPRAVILNRAAKYTLRDGVLQNAPAIDMSNRMPAGGYLTTAAELASFVTALLNGALVKPATVDEMMKPATLTTGAVVGYGLGWGVETEEWHGDRWTFHGGSSPGASGFIAVMPKHRFAVVFLTNLDELPERNELAADIARVVLAFAQPGNKE